VRAANENARLARLADHDQVLWALQASVFVLFVLLKQVN